MMNSKTAGSLRKLKNEITDEYLWQPSMQAGQPSLLCGYPVHIDEACPDPAAGTTPVAFGDFKRGYQIVDRTPLRVLRDAFTNKPYVHFYTTKRTSGALVDSNAIRLLKMADA